MERVSLPDATYICSLFPSSHNNQIHSQTLVPRRWLSPPTSRKSGQELGNRSLPQNVAIGLEDR